MGFDLVENTTQAFLNAMLTLLSPTAAAAAAAAAAVDDSAATDVSDPAPPVEEVAAMELASPTAQAEPSEVEKVRLASRELLLTILTGEVPIGLTLEFLYRANKSDLSILTHMKKSVDARNSLCHSAIVVAHSIMVAGTTSDTFLRDNLEWLSRATNWAKFTATATLGAIHKGHAKQAKQLLAPYLPQPGMSASPFSEGGSLYALGLIHANHGAPIRQYLLEALRNAGSNEVVQHGAALGIGISMMATDDEELYEELKGVLFNDSAVAGEAAALGMGLIMVGSGSRKAIEEMLGYAHDTQHEKIIRGLALGLAMAMYGREEEADSLISTLLLDTDPILRYGAMYTIAFAYACSGSNAALKRLLHVAVSDVSDDVRRAAVTAIGFVLASTPAQCPKVVKLLAESYNPHVRYGATLAVGVSCAGTGLKEALDLLHPLLSDPIDYVRQGALLATSMVLMQNAQHESDSRLSEHRKRLAKVVSDKHEDAMAKFGAIIATGLLDAGGRNMSISLLSKSGHKVMPAIVGIGVFTHFWFWHPLLLFVNLALTPTAAIGVNKSLQMPTWRFVSNAPPTTFAYPPSGQKEAKEEVKIAAAVLSITGKRKTKAELEADAEKAAEERVAAEKLRSEQIGAARDETLTLLASLKEKGALSEALFTEVVGDAYAATLAVAADAKDKDKDKKDKAATPSKRKAADESGAMDVDGDASKPRLEDLYSRLQVAHAKGKVATATLMAAYGAKPPLPPVALAKEGGEPQLEEAYSLPTLEHEVLENPARVLRTQERVIGPLPGSRYVPIAANRKAGIIVLRDATPDEAEDLLIVTAMHAAADNPDEEEPEPPAPFEFLG